MLPGASWRFLVLHGATCCSLTPAVRPSARLAVGYGNSSYGPSHYGDSGSGDSSYGNSGYGNSGYGDSGYGDSGYGQNINKPKEVLYVTDQVFKSCSKKNVDYLTKAESDTCMTNATKQLEGMVKSAEA